MRKLVIAAFALLACYKEPNVTIICDGAPCNEAGDLVSQSDAATSPDMSAIEGCANGAIPTYLGPNATGCARTFAAGQARQLCQNGWQVPILAAGIDLTKCDAEGAWFSGDAPAYWNPTMMQETCGTAVSQKLSYGCGKDGRMGYKKCGGFQRVLDTNANGWDTPNGALDNTSNNNPSRGVLCVKL
ncbi:MAG: hypothetical protein U1A78_15305 [Polyangia bacterium]